MITAQSVKGGAAAVSAALVVMLLFLFFAACGGSGRQLSPDSLPSISDSPSNTTSQPDKAIALAGAGTDGGDNLLDGGGEPEEDWPEWVVRDYYDPGLGQYIQIIDGRVIIAVKDPPPPPNVDPNFFDDENVPSYVGVYPEYPAVLEDPRVVQFLADTRAVPYSEWLSIRSFGVLLPPGVSVEYAVANWPSQYSQWMNSCEPDSLAEMHGMPNDFYACAAQSASWHLWGLNQGYEFRYGMRFYDAWELGNKGVSAYFRIAVADSGVDRQYQTPQRDLWARITTDGANVGDWGGSTEFRYNAGQGWVWVRDKKASWAKEWGHGTLVTGSIVGYVDNDPGSQQGGYNDVAGTTWYNYVYPIAMKHGGGFSKATQNCMYEVLGAVKRVYDPYQVWRKHPQIAAACSHYNLEIANFSFGGPDLPDTVKRHLDNLSPFILMIASAGNKGTTQVQYPAGHSGVLGIAAYGQNGYRAVGEDWASSYGNWVFAAAPTYYRSIDAIGRSPAPGYYVYGWSSSSEETWLFGGTSAAAPAFAGAAALVQSKYLNWTPLQVKQRLQNSLVSLPDATLPGRIDVVLATQ